MGEVVAVGGEELVKVKNMAKSVGKSGGGGSTSDVKPKKDRRTTMLGRFCRPKAAAAAQGRGGGGGGGERGAGELHHEQETQEGMHAYVSCEAEARGERVASVVTGRGVSESLSVQGVSGAASCMYLYVCTCTSNRHPRTEPRGAHACVARVG